MQNPIRPQLRAIRKQWRAVKPMVAMVRDDPSALVGMGRALLDARRAPAPSAADLGDRTPPAWLAEWNRAVSTSLDLDADASTVRNAIGDLSMWSEWMAFHVGWRGTPPQAVAEGEEIVEQVKLMGIPVDLKWTVVAVDDSEVRLEGRGPMGVMLALSASVEANGPKSRLFIDIGLDGDPMRGPMGASVLRNVDTALRESADTLAELLAGGVVGSGAAAPIKHERTGRVIDAHTPVIVGVGQVTQREPDTSKDPVALSAAALRLAAKDAGADLLTVADAVYTVASMSWQYNDQSVLVAEAVKAKPAQTVVSAPLGGDGAQLLVNDAARAITAGEAEIVLISGAETGATLAAAQKTQTTPNWPKQPSSVRPTRVLGKDEEGNHQAETRVGLTVPIYVYALIESAVRRVTGRDPESHTAAVAKLWSRFSAIAAGNPHAWQPEAFTPEELATPSAENRMITSPYTKQMCANLQVDQASGIIMCSAAAARDAGIPQDRWVFVHAGASAHDEWFVCERTELASSPAIRTIGSAALAHAGVSIDDVEFVDLYSCFPAAVQIAARELGLSTERDLSVTGGLTFGGGPGNNYGSHGVATLVEKLRKAPDSFGLATSLGWYLTKHAIGVFSATPPKQAFADLHPIVELPPSRPVKADYAGTAIVDAYTVPYDRDGEPEAAIISAITPDGARILVRTEDAEVIKVCVADDPLSRAITVDGDDATFTGTERLDLPEPPAPPVLVERRGAVTLITLNRPDVRNAVNSAMAEQLERAIDAFEADPNARVAVLTGAGGAFCAGMDLKAAARGELPVTEKRGPLGLTGKPPVKPLIAAVEGPALAGGCELALSADLIVATSESTFGIPEAKRGLVAAAGGVLRLAQRLPRAVVLELALTGDPMPAERLAELGLVNKVVKPGRALDAALELAGRIGANAPLSIAASKQIVDEHLDWSLDEQFDRQTSVASLALGSEDAMEGVRAFAEKRDPVWTGR